MADSTVPKDNAAEAAAAWCLLEQKSLIAGRGGCGNSTAGLDWTGKVRSDGTEVASGSEAGRQETGSKASLQISQAALQVCAPRHEISPTSDNKP